MFRNGVVFLLLLCSIEQIICPYCTYYPSYPGSMHPSYSKYCSDKCCSGTQTTSSSVCCEDSSFTKKIWIVPVAVVCSFVGLCIIIGIIRKRKPELNPAYQNPFVATPYSAYPMTTTTTPYGLTNQNNYYPSQYNMQQPMPNQQKQDNAPPSYDTFTHQTAGTRLFA